MARATFLEAFEVFAPSKKLRNKHDPIVMATCKTVANATTYCLVNAHLLPEEGSTCSRGTCHCAY